jgi:hypothetical protein
MNSANSRLTPRFYLLLFSVGLGTFLVHEFAHWLTGVSLGYEMVASPNHVRSIGEMSATHELLVSAAGPVITIVQAIAGFIILRGQRALFGFALLYMAFFMRLLAAVVSIFNPNDEARISEQLGLGTWTLPAIVVVFLFALVVIGSRRLELRFREQFVCYVTASIVVSLVVGLDALLG